MRARFSFGISHVASTWSYGNGSLGSKTLRPSARVRVCNQYQPIRISVYMNISLYQYQLICCSGPWRVQVVTSVGIPPLTLFPLLFFIPTWTFDWMLPVFKLLLTLEAAFCLSCASSLGFLIRTLIVLHHQLHLNHHNTHWPSSFPRRVCPC